MPNPITHPGLFDIFALDKVAVPGKTQIKSGGNRTLEYQEGMAPLTGGARVVLRYQKIAHVTYTVWLWQTAHFSAWDRFLAMLNAGRVKRPTRVYQLRDERLVHNQISQVTYEEVGPQQNPEPGFWTYDVSFIEYMKPRALGGPVKPPEDKQEQDIKDQEDANRVLRDALKLLEAAENAKK